jgi:hypothetical protein
MSKRALNRLGICGLLWLAAVPAAHAADAFAFDIAPGKFDEHCLKIEAGKTVRYRFTAGAAVDFNIHHHRGNEVLYPVKRDAVARAEGEFRAPASEDYCLMWTNKSRAQVRVAGEVAR